MLTVACLMVQVLFSGDHLAANAVGEWTSKYEDADDGFLGISRNFNCESHGFILGNGLLRRLTHTLGPFQGLCLKCLLLIAALLLVFRACLALGQSTPKQCAEEPIPCQRSGRVQSLICQFLHMQGGVLRSRWRAAQSWRRTTGSHCCRVSRGAFSACDACVRNPG